jgi:glycosyltransferase involved in cell wall biosynthesis
MRVANIIEEARIGGPQLRMVRVAVAMKESVQTIIFMPKENGTQFEGLCRKNGIPYQRLLLSRITKQLGPAIRYIVFSPIEIFILAKAFRDEDIDLVHVSGGSWQFKGIIAAKLAGVPSIWHLNDTLMPGWIRSIFGLLAPMTRGFVFASERTREYYSSILPNKIHEVISSTVDTKRFSPAAATELDKELLQSLGDSPVVGIVANINPVKGLENLIKAAQKIKKEVPNIQVVIIGAIHNISVDTIKDYELSQRIWVYLIV